MTKHWILAKLRTEFPEGTDVVVRGESRTGQGVFMAVKTVGTVAGWQHETTGAWYSARGDPNTPNKDGKLLLLRLTLRKLDGEITNIVIDDLTSIAKLEAR